MLDTKILKVKKVKNGLYYFIGLIFLFLNKLRHTIFGYTTPRHYPITEFARAIEYDFKIVEQWLDFLRKYSENSSIEGKTVLELGPGADLGVGIILLMKNVKKYNAIDINNLVKSVPDKFYEILFDYIRNTNNNNEIIKFLRSQLQLTRLGKNDRLNYIYDKNFDLSILKNEDIDFVFSQAAFEHFDDVEKTISQLSEIVKPGTILISEIDLKTHTRWIRDADPLNIYRYSDFIYNLFKFSGSPNRIRPYEYETILKKNGWTKIEIFPLTVLDKEYLSKVQNKLNKKFRDSKNQMNYLSITICATKK